METGERLPKCDDGRASPTEITLRQVRELIRWKGRDALRIANGNVELISLTGGGHFAAFRLLESDGRAYPNAFWEAPWTTIDPGRDWSEDMVRLYGPAGTGRFLAGFTGHAICLDYFGEPTPERVAAGLSLHGEASISKWAIDDSADPSKAQFGLTATLPISQLTFKREVRLEDSQSVAFVQESVGNLGDFDRHCDWVQHVTFGPPLLTEGESGLVVSARRGVTSPLGYEGISVLPDSVRFSWPYVKRRPGSLTTDLRRPFADKGRGFLAGIELDPERQIEVLLAVNWKLRFGVGYCFRRRDFPWMTIWEENCARLNAPWNGKTQARGMEFGTTPLPFNVDGSLLDEYFSDTPKGCNIKAHGKKTARYLMFLFAMPAEMHSVGNAMPHGDAILIFDEKGDVSFSVPAEGCEKFLA